MYTGVNGGVTTGILNLDNTSHSGRFTPGQEPPAPMSGRLGGPEMGSGLSGRLGRPEMGSGLFGEEKRLSTLYRTEPQTLNHQSLSSVTVVTELLWVSKHKCSVQNSQTRPGPTSLVPRSLVPTSLGP